MSDDSEQKRSTAASFGSASQHYLDSDVHRTGDDLDLLASWCEDATTALDIATGAGHTAGALAKRGVPNVVAADASPPMVATAVREFSVDGVVADAERVPFGDDVFDAVTCRIAAHHFPDPEAFVSEVARVLRPGGTFAFEDNVVPSDPALGAFMNEVDRLRDPTHVKAYETDTWQRRLRANGFRIEETTHLKKTLEFDSWSQTQSLSESQRERVERKLLNAPPEATSFFEIVVDDGNVVSFDTLKVMLKAKRVP